MEGSRRRIRKQKSSPARVEGGAREHVGDVEPDRRAFLKKAAVAAVGAAAAAPVVGAHSAYAAGSSPAYTDSPNTFTADQRVNGHLGVNIDATRALDVLGQTDDWAAAIRGPWHASFFEHSVDLNGAPYDCVNVFHRGSGDGVFVNHLGGLPPSYPGPTAGNAGFNVMVPETLDHTGLGRDGTQHNDRRGQTGVNIDTFAPNG